MRVAEFHFDLPDDLIAQTPPAERGSSRMLLLDRHTGAVDDRNFRDLPSLLRPGDLLVVNDTRVLPARLYATRHQGPGRRSAPASPAPTVRIEVLLTEPHAPRAGGAMPEGGEPDQGNEWNALVKPGKKVHPGDRLLFAADLATDKPLLEAEVVASGPFGERVLRFAPVPDFAAILEQIGHMPLPPYIKRPRNAPDRPEDRERYQTIYAQTIYARDGDSPGSPAANPRSSASRALAATERSAAAPTAGLHFTPALLAALAGRGVETATITLHVGRGTFQPVRVDDTEQIRLHAERYTLSPETASAINRARAEGRRVIAVGTTTTRTLEHCARLAADAVTHDLQPGSGETSLFLSPGVDFQVISGLLTNFHLPGSTLLMLVSAFAGRDPVLHAYRHAVAQRYRFFSYGDCMLVL